MRTTAVRTLAALAALCLLSFPHDSASQCNDPAARNLLAGGLADAVLNPPAQEDNQFFTSQGGFPNIFFLLDTSGSMQRHPPNGPPSGETGTLPPEHKVGCGGASEFGDLDGGSVLDIVAGRTYHSPCGQTAWDNLPYQGHPTIAGGVDYAQFLASNPGGCPFYTPSETFDYGKGYDPDFFNQNDPDNLSAGGGRPNFFPKDLVFHDSLRASAWSSNGTANGNGGDGWTFSALFPWRRLSDDRVGSIAEFCAAQGAALGGSAQAVCNACLAKKGWYYDGTHRDFTSPTEFSGTLKVPSIWYTGNYLSFFPPKFIVARRVVKDVIANQSRIRMALAQFGTNEYRFVRDLNPSCQSIFSSGTWEQNRSAYINSVNSLAWAAGVGTPLAMSLFDVGRFYHTPTLDWFGPAWEKPNSGPVNWESDTSANQLAVCWSCQVSSVILLTDGVPTAGDGDGLPTNPSSIASANSGVYAGDPSTGILNPLAADCPRCWDFTGTEASKNNLAKVAFYLHNYDLRGEPGGACGGAGTTLDGKGMPGKQVLDVYTVGFGTSAFGTSANRILANAASAGGGIFVATEAADQLRAGIFKVFSHINERATSFSVATVSTLQTTTGHSVIVPRFDPSRDPHWAGHLYRYELYSEFVNPCTPNGPGDLDCDGLCASVFLQDKNGRFIGEDGSGSFMQTDNGLPPCSETPRCVALSRSCGALTNTPASPWWDAYEALKAQGWKTRYVWTVTDSNTDGKLTSADRMVRLDTSDATADALVPYLGLGTSGGVCAGLAQKIETAGDPVTAQVVRGSKRECTKTIVRWLLGADVLNEMGRNEAQGWPPPRPFPSLPATAGDATATPPVPANLPDQEQLLDRRFKLGDIYHSSPVVVDAPLPASGILCPNGLHNQCMESLWRTPVRHVNDVNQYELYATNAAFKNRRKMILVGSNDGLLHAFNGGRWHPNADDPVSAGIDESVAPFGGYYDRGEGDGPVELWAFLPPDLLGKIPNLLGAEHHLFVDGTAMVRDVWVDGPPGNGIATPAPTKDGRKAASEFHTVAVVGERRGGTHYFALDVTNAANLPSESGDHAPRFLWIYPQPNDPESLQFGETYTDFLPVPPPVGPVRIRADGNAQTYGLADATNAPSMYVPEDPTNAVKYHELWVTMLPGGFDPSYLRGRGVHMVDVWRGTEVFDFSYPADGVARGWNDPRMFLQFPIAATPAMVMWGKEARRPSLGFENDGYFDTATFGDTGGQLWVLRFNRPATLDTSGRATNWFGGRIMLNGRWSPTTGSLCAGDTGHPFFYITSNTALPGSHVFRVYAGTGDRFNLLDTNGGICGPDNVRACAQRGCTVSLPLANNVLAASETGRSGEGLSQPVCPTGTSPLPCLFNRTFDTASAPPACGVTAASRIEVTACPDATGPSAFSKDVALRCTPDADGSYGCTQSKASLAGSLASYGATVDQSPNLTTRPMSLNWYFSMKVFEDSGWRGIFDSESRAAEYDWYVVEMRSLVSSTSPMTVSLRQWTFDSNPVVVFDGADDNPTTLADASSPGWAIYYNHGPQISTDDHVYNVNPLDERTSSVSGLYGKVLWNTIQPALSEATTTVVGCRQSKCQAAFRRLSYHYAADAVTGGPVLRDASGNLLRALVQNTLVPAQGDQPTVFVNQKGQIAVGLTAVNPEKGASNLGMGPAMDPVVGLGVVEVSQDLHDCRHAPSAVGVAAPDASKCK